MYKNLVARRVCALAVTSFFSFSAHQASAQSSTVVVPPLKVAFVYVAPLTEAGWVRQHERGRLAVEAALGDRVQTTYV